MKQDDLQKAAKAIEGFGSPILKEILAEELWDFHARDPANWALSTKSARHFRVHFGPFIVFSVEQERIWLALDQQGYEEHADQLRRMSSVHLDKRDYPNYKKGGLNSQNIYVENQITTESWALLRRLHLTLIDRVHQRDYQLRPETRKNHSTDLNLYLAVLLEQSAPLSALCDSDTPDSFRDLQTRIRSLAGGETERAAAVSARIGQDVFRRLLLHAQKTCLICGIQHPDLLKASHIKPWRYCSNEDRLNIANGLLLCSLHDSLFDAGLLSFDAHGRVLVSERLSESDRKRLALPGFAYELPVESAPYIEWHRENQFKRI